MDKEEGKKMLGLAIEIAVAAHKGQVDKGGFPYILHPLHLMNQLMFDLELATIAVLHDVVEDSKWSLEALKAQGFSARVIAALGLLTHHKGDSYSEYIAKMSELEIWQQEQVTAIKRVNQRANNKKQ